MADTTPPAFDLGRYMAELGVNARRAARRLARAETAQKNAALRALARLLGAREEAILAANAADLEAARARGLDAALLDRLALNPARVAAMAQGVADVATLPDPVGTITDLAFRPSGIQVGRMRVPLGVVGIVYEARPNVTADASALCLKAGNCAILRGGAEALRSNTAIAAAVADALAEAGLPPEAVQVLSTTDRAAVGLMVSMPEAIDVVIPRGGKGLVAAVSAGARVPVIKHLDGICHLFVDRDADLEKAVRIADNAKTHRYGTCNTLETLLVDAPVAEAFLPQIASVYAAKGVDMRGCPETLKHVPTATPATPEDWDTEYLAPIVAIRVVDGLDAAMDHIAAHSSAHTESIVTENLTRARRFLREVDSSSVMVNASTRFADGFEYGLGAEIGISTDKFHARGPVGLEGLTSQKWVVLGDGHVRG